VELAARTGATIHIGHRAGAAFPHHAVHEGDEITMGRVVLRFLETPGHTPESLCVLVIDRAVSEQPVKVLTGDTLFIGDVGRPDLVSSKGFSSRDMAAMLHDSLHAKLLALPDAVEVWPAHGAGSACGRAISSDRSSTIGAQRRLNWALQPMARDTFVDLLTTDLQPAPRYFSHDAEHNRRGAPALADLPRPAALSPAEVQRRAAAGAVVLDVRDKVAHGAGHVSGSINIGLGGSFATWSGALLPLDGPLILVADEPPAQATQVEEAVMRLARVGLHAVAGYLDGGLQAWRAAGLPVATLTQLPVEELAPRRDLFILDVRGPGEYAAAHARGAVSIPLPQLAERAGELDLRRPTAVICASGYRSSAACGLLRRAGFTEVVNVAGGTNAWVAANLPTDAAPAAAPARAT
jgi:rhodanese-related sulfurtransferase